MGNQDYRNGGRVSQSFVWGLANGADIEFYKELERRGKETPLSNLPDLDIIDSYYLQVVTQMRKLANPITLPDIAAYCELFPVKDKARLVEVISKLNMVEQANG